MGNNISTGKKILSGFLLILFVGYMGSISLFCHTHRVNGCHVTHSHPYSDAPDTGRHTHTSVEYVAIALLSSLLLLAASFGSFFFLFPVRILKKADLLEKVFLCQACPTLSLRGPPAR